MPSLASLPPTMPPWAAWTTIYQRSPFYNHSTRNLPLFLARKLGSGKGLAVPGDGEIRLVADKAKPANNWALKGPWGGGEEGS